ncbi:MAG: hypothetical protein U0X75_02960 [Acidobacteriota bacterium]
MIKAFFSGRGGRLGANTALLTVGVIGSLAVATSCYVITNAST